MKDITMNCDKRPFYLGTRNTRAQIARAGCGLMCLLIALALVFMTPRITMGALLSVDVGAHSLVPDQASPQMIFLFVNNSSGAPITVGSLDFYIELGGGSGTTPSISGVDLLGGTIFSGGNQTGDAGNGPQLQFYAVTKASGPGPDIPTGPSPFAAISIITQGTAGGSFPLSLAVSGVGNTDYFTDTTTPTGLGLSIVNGSVNLAAVPEASSVVAAIFIVLVAVFHTLRQRRTRAGA